MRKKILGFLILLFLIVTMTGCVKYNVTMEIKEDKSMDFDIIYAFNTQVFGDNELLKADERKNVELNGFEVIDYEDGDMKGVRISKKFSNIDDVSLDKKVEYDLGDIFENKQNEQYFFQMEKGEEKNKYTAIIKFDSNDSSLNASEVSDDESEEASQDLLVDSDDDLIESTEEDDDEDSSLDYTALMNFDLKFVVKLPTAALSNNATVVSEDGKTLEWELTTDEASSIEFSFEMGSEKVVDTTDFKKIIIIGGLAVLVIVIIVVILMKTRKGKGGNKDLNIQTAIPVQPEPVPVTPVYPEPVTTVVEPVPVTPANPEPVTTVVEPVPVTPANPEPVTTVVEPAPAESESVTTDQQSNNQQQ